MPSTSQDSYAGSCNPTRRAKQTRIDISPVIKATTSAPTMQRNILPLPTPNIEEVTGDEAPSVPPQVGPAKRGRKPGPLSRSAREAQRKLNHSIIEKARRTKINDALATLRQLVPLDYGYSKSQSDEAGGEEEEEEVAMSKKDKPKGSSKREEKEKEFKLEILVRTVSYMQDLLARVKKLEEGTPECSKCSHGEVVSKTKHDLADEEHRPRKRSRRDSTSVGASQRTRDNDQHAPEPSPSLPSRPYLGSRLPSISAWLPDHDGKPLSLSPNQRRGSDSAFQLPSPPSSTHFDPIQASQAPPVLNLGPVASSALLSPLRTPDDESAASMLLQISSAPPQHLPSPAAGTSFYMSKMRTSCVTPVDQSKAQFPQAQTPGSLLGLTRRSIE